MSKPTPKKTKKPTKKLGAPPGGFTTHTSRITTSSKTHTWRTPEWFLDLVRQLDAIGLDPSADTHPKRQFARVNYDGKKLGDGLKRKWRGHGLVYCNPPYGRKLVDWVKKTCRAFASARASTDELVMLIPARPDTRYFGPRGWTIIMNKE